MTATVEPFLTTRFRCSTCRKSYADKNKATAHAAECIHDPGTRACATCRHDDRGYVGGWDEPGYPPCCRIAARREDESFVRGCEKWEGKWRAAPAAMP